jgi:hypothetical protein
MNMKLTNMELTGLLAGTVLTLASFGAYAESHMAEALKHAEAAAKADDTKSIVEHAEAAKTHAKTADEHLDAGITSLNDAIDHGKMKHADSAKKSAEEAVTHLKAAQETGVGFVIIRDDGLIARHFLCLSFNYSSAG